MRGDKGAVLAAVKQDGRALEDAGEEMRGDKEVVLAAVKQNRRVFKYASAEMREDKEVLCLGGREASGNAGREGCGTMRHCEACHAF